MDKCKRLVIDCSSALQHKIPLMQSGTPIIHREKNNPDNGGIYAKIDALFDPREFISLKPQIKELKSKKAY